MSEALQNSIVAWVREKTMLVLACVPLVIVLLSWQMVVKHPDSWSRVQKERVIRIGYAIEPPYAFPGGDGQAAGESPETARGIVALMGGMNIEWRLADFGMLIDLLEGGEIDVIAAGVFITPERMARVAFSPPIGLVHAGLLVRKGNPHRLHCYGDLLAAAPHRVAVLAGSVEAGILVDAGLPAERLLVVPDVQSGRAAVVAGRAIALALSRPSVRWLASRDWDRMTEAVEDFEECPLPSENGIGRIGFAFRREDRHLASEWRKAQATYLATNDAAAIASRYGFETSRMSTP